MSIEPRNITAQIQHRAAGNPPSTLPDAAISNCFPGLEFDARNIWRRIFVGIEVHEASGEVTAGDGDLSSLVGMFLIRVGEVAVLVQPHGPTGASEDAPIGFAFLEWSNALADAVAAGGPVECEFRDGSLSDQSRRTLDLPVRPLFDRNADGDVLPVLAEDVLGPGELTQSLCSPWQNDYRECGCYYWAASRPDYVNVEPTADGATTGTSWMAKNRAPTGYIGDNGRSDPRQFSYDDLFRNWQGVLPFVVDGRDHD